MRSIVILFTIALLISGCNNKNKERVENIQESDTYVDEYQMSMVMRMRIQIMNGMRIEIH